MFKLILLLLMVFLATFVASILIINHYVFPGENDNGITLEDVTSLAGNFTEKIPLYRNINQTEDDKIYTRDENGNFVEVQVDGR